MRTERVRKRAGSHEGGQNAGLGAQIGAEVRKWLDSEVRAMLPVGLPRPVPLPPAAVHVFGQRLEGLAQDDQANPLRLPVRRTACRIDSDGCPAHFRYWLTTDSPAMSPVGLLNPRQQTFERRR